MRISFDVQKNPSNLAEGFLSIRNAFFSLRDLLQLL